MSRTSCNDHAPQAEREGASRDARGGRDPSNFGILVEFAVGEVEEVAAAARGIKHAGTFRFAGTARPCIVILASQTGNEVDRSPRSGGSPAAGFNVSGLFYNLGRRLGRVTIPAIRKTKWIYDGLAGSEDDALRAEARLGHGLAAELRAATPPASDPTLTPLVAELCRRLAACVRDKRRAFHCEVIRGESPNAMALPGGFVFISHSLVELCERRPDELAFVIGHEMAHIIRGHAWDRMLSQAVLRVASTVGSRAGVLGGWLRTNGREILQSAHSRDSELEADEFGLRLAAAARFAPEGASALLQRLERLGGAPDLLGQYFASHPPASERRLRLQEILRQWSVSRSGQLPQVASKTAC